jgi:probable HAF family extracellular repeat protein
MNRFRATCLLSLAVLTLGVRAQAQYSVQFLGTLGGNRSEGLAVNNAGKVVGSSNLSTAVFPQHPFYWDGNTMVDLGTFGGQNGSATDINDAGVIVGHADLPNTTMHAFRWRGSGLEDLGTLGGSSSHAHSINSSGVIGGVAKVGTEKDDRPAIWTEGIGWQELPTPPLDTMLTYLLGINDLGEAAGVHWIDFTFTERHAVKWSGGVMQDLGTLGGTAAFGTAINNDGWVTGQSQTSGNTATNVFLWNNSTMLDLGTLGGNLGRGEDINNLGHIVGYSNLIAGSADSRALFWSQSTGMIDLNQFAPAGWTLTHAYGISDTGYITGRATNAAGAQRAFLLTPTAAAVPEPGAWGLLLGLAGGGIVAFRRRRK